MAVLVLAYKRLPLLAFTVTFTVLFVAYTAFGAPAGLWKGLLLADAGGAVAVQPPARCARR